MSCPWLLVLSTCGMRVLIEVTRLFPASWRLGDGVNGGVGWAPDTARGGGHVLLGPCPVPPPPTPQPVPESQPRTQPANGVGELAPCP